MKPTCTLRACANKRTPLAALVAAACAIQAGANPFNSGTSSTISNDFAYGETLFIGIQNPANTLVITNNAAVSATRVVVGELSTSTNNLLRVEAGSLLVAGNATTNGLATGGLVVGAATPAPALSVNNGSAVEATHLYVGFGTNDSGRVELSGDGTAMRVGDVHVGYSGSTNTVDLRSGAALAIGGTLNVGTDGGSVNALNVHAQSSVFVNSTNAINVANPDRKNGISIKSGGTLQVGGDVDTGTLEQLGVDLAQNAVLELGGVLTLGNNAIDNGLNIVLDNNLSTNHTASWLSASVSSIGGTTANNSLTLTNGANAATTQMVRIGSGANARNNTLNVGGTGSNLRVNQDMLVGAQGANNAFNITDGGTAEIDKNLYLGSNATATGNKVNVGSNGVLKVEGNVVVGELGKANAFTIAGGNVKAQSDFILGSGSADNVYAQTSGTNDVAGSFIVGKAAGATGKTGFVDSDRVETTGNLALVGEGAVLDIGQDLLVGKKGGGSVLAIRDGGSVNVAGDAVIGEAVGDNYIYLQRDAGTRFDVGGDLVVGVEGGVNRFAVYGGTANVGGDLFLGASTNQHAEKNFIHLETTNAVLNVAQAFHIGASNSLNTLDIKAGATASAHDFHVGAFEGVSNNVVTVTGDGSLLSITNLLAIGSHSGSNNTVNVGQGGTLFVLAPTNIVVAGADAGNRLAINGGGTLQTIDWDFAAVTTNIAFNSGSALELGGTLSGTNRIDGGVEFRLAGSNAVWNTGADLLAVGYDSGGNMLTVTNGGFAATSTNLVVGHSADATGNTLAVAGAGVEVGAELVVGAGGDGNTLLVSSNAVVNVAGSATIGSASRNNLLSLSGSNAVLNVGIDLVVGDAGGDNSATIGDGAVATVAGSAWIGVASSGNSIEVTGTNSLLEVGLDFFVGSTNVASSGSQLGVYDTASVRVGGNLALANGSLEIDFGSHVEVKGDYSQDADSTLAVRLSTNSVVTNLVVDGAADFAKGTTIAVFGDDTIPAVLVDDEGVTNKVSRTIVDAGRLLIGGQDATTPLLQTGVNFQTNALFGFSYSVTNNSIYLDNFTLRSIADAAGLDGMLAGVADQIEELAAASNSFAKAMREIFQDGMEETEINRAMQNYYGEKTSSTPAHNVVNLGIQFVSERLAMRADNTRARMGAASARVDWNKPAGAAAPHMAGQELQGWMAGYGTWGEQDAAGGFAGYEADIRGFLVGADLSVAENILVGIAGGSGFGSVDKDNGASTDTRTVHGAVYASAGTRDWFADAGLVYGGTSVDTKLGTTFDTRAKYDAQNVALYVGGGKEITGRYLIVTPQASLFANYYKQDAYEEEASNAVGRKVDRFDALYLQSSLGCSLGVYAELGGLVLKPEIRIHWLHEFNAREEDVSYSLIGGAGNYTLQLQAPEEDILKLGAGVSTKLGEYLELRADIDTRQGSDYSDFSLLGSLRYQF